MSNNTKYTYYGDNATTLYTAPAVDTNVSTLKVYEDGVLQTITTNYTHDTTNNQVTFVVAPASGVVIELVRSTSIASRKVDFTNITILDEDTQNNNTAQLFNRLQEIDDDWTVARRVIKKKADEAITSDDTLTADSELTFSVTSGGIYTFLLTLNFTSGTTPDFKFAWGYPSNTTMLWSSSSDETATLTATGSGAKKQLIYNGTIWVGDTSGTISLKWAQNTSDAGTTTVHSGSCIVVDQIA